MSNLRIGVQDTVGTGGAQLVGQRARLIDRHERNVEITRLYRLAHIREVLVDLELERVDMGICPPIAGIAHKMHAGVSLKSAVEAEWPVATGHVAKSPFRLERCDGHGSELRQARQIGEVGKAVRKVHDERVIVGALQIKLRTRDARRDILESRHHGQARRKPMPTMSNKDIPGIGEARRRDGLSVLKRHALTQVKGKTLREKVGLPACGCFSHKRHLVEVILRQAVEHAAAHKPLPIPPGLMGVDRGKRDALARKRAAFKHTGGCRGALIGGKSRLVHHRQLDGTGARHDPIEAASSQERCADTQKRRCGKPAPTYQARLSISPHAISCPSLVAESVP